MQPSVVTGLGKRLHAWTATIKLTLARYLKEAGAQRPDVAAALLFAAIDGAAQHYVLDPRHYPLADVADEIIARFTRDLERS